MPKIGIFWRLLRREGAKRAFDLIPKRKKMPGARRRNIWIEPNLLGGIETDQRTSICSNREPSIEEMCRYVFDEGRLSSK